MLLRPPLRPFPSRVWIIDTRTGQSRALFPDKRDVGAMKWSPDASRLAILVRRGDAWQVRYRCDKETETVRWQLIKNGTRLKYQVLTEAEAERRPGWEYDWRRCMVGRNVGNFDFRFSSSYGPPYVIEFYIGDPRVPDFKVGSVWLGRSSWVPDDGKLGSRAQVLPPLRQKGNTLVVYSTDGDSVLRWQIEGGDKVAKFLIDCPR